MLLILPRNLSYVLLYVLLSPLIVYGISFSSLISNDKNILSEIQYQNGINIVGHINMEFLDTSRFIYSSIPAGAPTLDRILQFSRKIKIKAYCPISNKTFNSFYQNTNNKKLNVFGIPTIKIPTSLSSSQQNSLSTVELLNTSIVLVHPSTVSYELLAETLSSIGWLVITIPISGINNVDDVKDIIFSLNQILIEANQIISPFNSIKLPKNFILLGIRIGCSAIMELFQTSNISPYLFSVPNTLNYTGIVCLAPQSYLSPISFKSYSLPSNSIPFLQIYSSYSCQTPPSELAIPLFSYLRQISNNNICGTSVGIIGSKDCQWNDEMIHSVLQTDISDQECQQEDECRQECQQNYINNFDYECNHNSLNNNPILSGLQQRLQLINILSPWLKFVTIGNGNMSRNANPDYFNSWNNFTTLLYISVTSPSRDITSNIYLDTDSPINTPNYLPQSIYPIIPSLKYSQSCKIGGIEYYGS